MYSYCYAFFKHLLQIFCRTVGETIAELKEGGAENKFKFK
jgi:hypothetical protein